MAAPLPGSDPFLNDGTEPGGTFLRFPSSLFFLVETLEVADLVWRHGGWGVVCASAEQSGELSEETLAFQ